MSARSIIEAFGGGRRLAELLGCHEQTIYAWGKRNIIPAKKQRLVIDVAKANKIKVKPEDFFKD